MAKQSPSEMKFGLATVIPWSLVLVLGTLYVSDYTQPRSNPQTVDNTVEPEPDSPEEIKRKAVAKALDKVRDAFVKIESEADRALIYKLFAGSAEYLSHAVSLQTTAQFDPMLGRVQSSYGWEREKYDDFTDAVSDYLVEAGYDEPRKLSTEEDRKWFRDIFKSLTDAVKG